MSSLSVSNEQATAAAPGKAKVIQPAWVRALHWTNAFAMVLMIMSGWQIYKPVQLQWLTALFGGYNAARYVHFFCMAAIVAFMVVHVVLALIVPKSLRAMIIGR